MNVQSAENLILVWRLRRWLIRGIREGKEGIHGVMSFGLILLTESPVSVMEGQGVVFRPSLGLLRVRELTEASWLLRSAERRVATSIHRLLSRADVPHLMLVC
jgi:hypothetical protein